MTNQDESGFLDHDPDDPFAGPVPDEYKGLIDRLGQQSEGWKPKPGDLLYGTLLDISDAESEYGGYPLLTVEAPTGQCIDVHCFHTVLKREVERRLRQGSLREGVMVAIKYYGQVGSASKGSPSHMYKLVISQPEA